MIPNKNNWPYTNVVDPEIYKGRTDWPKISIVTPSYNQGQYIEETILSILNQNYPNLEYIIIDGGSTDHTVEIIKKYEDRITYWVSEKDNGQSHAINKGFEKASGDYTNWLNSDDILEKNALFNLSKEIIETDPTLIIGLSSHWNSKTNITYKHTTTPKQYKDLLNYDKLICIAQPSAFYKLEYVKKRPLDNSLHYTMDLEYWLYLGSKFGPEKKIKLIESEISLMRIHQDQKTSSQNWAAMKEAQKIILKYSSIYKISNLNKVKLLFNYRLMRYNNALAYKKRAFLNIYFFEITIFKVLKKINVFFNHNSNIK